MREKMNKYNVLAFSVKAAIVGAGVYAFTPAMANEPTTNSVVIT